VHPSAEFSPGNRNGLVNRSASSLAPADRLGVYEIVSLLGPAMSDVGD
jgi:hypothetical protein